MKGCVRFVRNRAAFYYFSEKLSRYYSINFPSFSNKLPFP